jgi:hypothetical protein
MKTDDGFRHIGKETPYKIPAGFFESITENTLQQAILSEKNHKRNNIRRMVLSVAASVAVLFFLGYYFIQNPAVKTPLNMVAGKTQTSGQIIIQEKQESADQIAALETMKTSPVKSSVRKTTEKIMAEGLNDVLSDMSDEEIQQMAAMYNSDTFINEITQ